MTPEAIIALGFTPHTPGEVRPVDQDVLVRVLFDSGDGGWDTPAGGLVWGAHAFLGSRIIGWRYADPADANRALTALDSNYQTAQANWDLCLEQLEAKDRRIEALEAGLRIARDALTGVVVDRAHVLHNSEQFQQRIRSARDQARALLNPETTDDD